MGQGPRVMKVGPNVNNRAAREGYRREEKTVI